MFSLAKVVLRGREAVFALDDPWPFLAANSEQPGTGFDKASLEYFDFFSRFRLSVRQLLGAFFSGERWGYYDHCIGRIR